MSQLDSFTMVMSIPLPSKAPSAKLPYDPFLFNMFLVPIFSDFPKSLEVEHQIMPGAARILGKADRDIVVPYSTISRDHCSFHEGCVQDMGSTTGTYLWMTAECNHRIENGDIFIVGEKQHVLQILQYQKQKLQYSLNGQKHAVVVREKELLIGSSLGCDIVDPTLKDVEGRILLDGTISHYQVMDRVTPKSGIWLRLSPKGQQSKPYPLKQQDVLMVGPVIYQLRY